ncbi:MAG: hypothetical protein H6506_04865 [Calditrichaeota bacterium]|nr:hypothetical protein [Calditrichota bacterium]MCB9391967.1 hypothetical protein [Calditrichota bacterium]
MKLATNILAIFCGFLSYIIYARLFERRWPKEISLRGFFPVFGKGLGVGALLFSATMLILWVGGFWTLEGTNSLWVTATALGISLAGFFEELLVRGVLYRILEESLGTWIAVAVCMIAAALMLRLVVQRGLVKQPFWRSAS